MADKILKILILSLILSGCASSQQQAWNHYETGMLLVFNGYDSSKDKTDQVEKNYLKALEYNPKLPAVNASLGTYKAKKGDYQAANSYFEKEVTLHPDAAKAMLLVLNKNLIKKEEKPTNKQNDKKEEHKEEKKDAQLQAENKSDTQKKEEPKP